MFTTKDILGFELPYYGIMVLIGISFCVVALKFTRRKRQNAEPIEYVCMGLISFIFAFFGAHIVYGLTNIDKIFFVVTHPSRLFKSFDMFLWYMNDIWGGMVFYGGLIGACVSAYIYMRLMKLDVAEYSDTLVPCIPLFHVFGRIGCFLSGCCYGIESEFGFTYHYSMLENVNGVCRLPIQLIESAENLILFILFMVLLFKCRNIKHGILIWIYGMLYPVIRFINEFFRGDFEERGYFGIFSTSQWISIILFVFSVVMLIRTMKTKGQTSESSNELKIDEKEVVMK